MPSSTGTHRSHSPPPPEQTNDSLSTSKSILIIALVLGCFAVLWPKIFYPMLVGSRVASNSGRQDFMRQEREFGLPGHPAMRDRSRMVKEANGVPPRHTIDNELRPGPVPGMRPTMGGPGIQAQEKRGGGGGGGPMSILMPLYTIGIVIFFLYTIMKVAFKKNEDEYDTKQTATSRSNFDSVASDSYKTLNMAAEIRRNAHLRAAEQQQQRERQEQELLQQQRRQQEKEKQESEENITSGATPEEAPKDEDFEEEEKQAQLCEKSAPMTLPDCNMCLRELTEALPESADKLGDVEIQLLKERLLETEKAMAKIVEQMQQAGGVVPELDNSGRGDKTKKSEADDKSEDTDAEADQKKSSEATVDCDASEGDSTSGSEVENEEEFVLRQRKVVQEVKEE